MLDFTLEMPQQAQRLMRAAWFEDISRILAVWDECTPEVKGFIIEHRNQIIGSVSKHGNEQSIAVITNFLWCHTEDLGYLRSDFWASPNVSEYFAFIPHILGRLNGAPFIYTDDTRAFVSAKKAAPSLVKSIPFSFFDRSDDFNSVRLALKEHGYTLLTSISGEKLTPEMTFREFLTASVNDNHYYTAN